MKVNRFGTIDPCLQVGNADKILDEVFQVAGELEMKPFLLWGTCLGFVRDGGYIKGDNDLDIGVICNGKGERKTLTAQLKKKGYDHGSPCRLHCVHFYKNKVLVDIYFLEATGFYSKFDNIKYKGKIYPVPRPIQGFLEASYSNWKIKENQTARVRMVNQEQFWKIRSKKFNKLNGLKDISYIKTFIRSGEFKESDTVLDVGTGTGIIAHAISPIVKKVIGIDASQDMLDRCEEGDNNLYIKGDIRDLKFPDNGFDKITARLVFHHIIDDTQKAMDECYRVLKRGGKMILAEAIPPTPKIRREYINIFKLKEERLTFTEDELVNLMAKSGFKNIMISQHITKNFSVNNWLENSGLPKNKQDRIFELHINGSDTFKKAYNMKITEDDCFIDIKNLILVGKKRED